MNDILNMQAGRELDVEVHRRLFNYKYPTVEEMEKEALEQWIRQPDCRYFMKNFEAWREIGEFKWRYSAPSYSTSWNGSGKVMDELFSRYHHIQLTTEEQLWGVRLNAGELVLADTAPHAICIAALLALEGNRGD